MQTGTVTPLAVHPCQRVCTWAPAGRQRGGLPLFRCSGCGSEWVRSEPWTPAGADGVVAPDVAAEVAREGARRRTAPPATSAGDAAAAGSAGS